MAFAKIDFNKYESYIRVAHNSNYSDAQNFPTPSSVGRSLKDVDLDAYTDLTGHTQRTQLNSHEDAVLNCMRIFKE